MTVFPDAKNHHHYYSCSGFLVFQHQILGHFFKEKNTKHSDIVQVSSNNQITWKVVLVL